MSNKSQELLKKKQFEYIINSKEYKDSLIELCKDIKNKCKTAENEATVVSCFELELFSFMKEILGIKYFPEKEYSINTKRHISKGRIDSKLGALIIEFKQPSKLKSENQKKSTSKQIKEYLEGLYLKNETDYMGIVSDGLECQILKMEHGKIIEGAYEELESKHLDVIIRNVVLLDKVALTPENLVKDFCEDEENNFTKNMTKVFYDTLKNNSTDKSLMLFQEWKELFRLAHDDKSKQKAIEERRKSLEDIIGKKLSMQDDEYLALYSLQTTYALIVKTIAYKVISKIKFNKSLIEFSQLSTADSDSLRFQMSELEDGAIFRNLGINNLLEGDFFSWYSTNEQWNESIGNLVRKIFEILTPYEDKAIFDKSENVSDLFKDLYMSVIPDKVRHSLGEFYTPPWLSDTVIDTALKDIKNTNWKGLDPCTGSGTFLTLLISKVLNETKGEEKSYRLKSVLERVKGIDLNPLAVLTARINYFINISTLISDEDEFEIPVYLGDSSYVPSKVIVEEVTCLSYKIQTIKGEIEILLPVSVVSDSNVFSRTMTSIEDDIHNLDEEAIVSKLINLIPIKEQKTTIIENIKSLASKFIELERNDWNGIWARIVTNFLTTANLGHFDIIVGNPPWIDWKNLPAGYRERIKGLCIERHLFSGDKLTGGINLNICALISNVCAQNWLSHNGTLAFLMPQSLLFQQTYEGFREFQLDNEEKLYLQEIHDWTESGHPFKPVQQKFLTYFFSSTAVDYKKGIPLTTISKKVRDSLSKYQNTNDFSKISHIFDFKKGYAGQVNNSTIFSCASTKKELNAFRKISGYCEYVGREGVEFYPQELFLLEIDESMPQKTKNKVFVKNFQNKKSKYKIPEQTVLLETKFLHPLIKGVDIQRFHIKPSKFLVPFPYNSSNTRSPIPLKELSAKSPLLAKYFNKFKNVLMSQSDYNSKIIGKKHNKEFYALARVGEYSFAKNYVAFRDNSKWQAAVVSDIETPWNEIKRPQFQNHAVTISQDETGRFITLDEAHFICAIFNAPLTSKYIYNSSDSRTFKIRPQIKIPIYDESNEVHKELSNLSRFAHENYANIEIMKDIDLKLNELIIKLK